MKIDGYKTVFTLSLILLVFSGCNSIPDMDYEPNVTSISSAISEYIDESNEIYSKRIAEIIYQEYLLDCKTEEAPSWFKGMEDDDETYISAICKLIDLNNDGADELIIQKQLYGGVMWTEFVVYSIEKNEKLFYLQRPGLGFEILKDNENNTIILIENEYSHDSEKYFINFNSDDQCNYLDFINNNEFVDNTVLFIADNATFNYFHSCNNINESYCYFNGNEVIVLNSKEYKKRLDLLRNSMKKNDLAYIEFKLINSDFRSKEIMADAIRKYF